MVKEENELQPADQIRKWITLLEIIAWIKKMDI